jgi:Arc/MetJ family transcription regulator
LGHAPDPVATPCVEATAIHRKSPKLKHHSALNKASFDDSIDADSTGDLTMRTTLALDDDLLVKATALTGVAEKSALVREALRALIQRESAKRLAQLGGTMPGLQDIPRRQGSAQ